MFGLSSKTNAAPQEERFRYLVENGREAVILINPHGIITYATPNLHRVLGYSAEEYVGRDAFAIIHPDDLQKARDLFSTILQNSGSIGTAVVRAQVKSGPWRWIEGTAQNLLHTPQVQAIVCNIQDITAEKEAQEALRQKEELNTRILESLPAGVMQVDAAGSLIQANGLAISMLGLNSETPVNLREVLGTGVYPDGSACLLEDQPLFRCLLTGQRQPSRIVGVQRPDGATCWAAFSAAPFFNAASGKQEGAILSLLDVTPQIEAERKVRWSQARFEMVARATLDVIWDWDIQNDSLWWNENYSIVFGYSPADVPHSLAQCQQRCHPDDLPNLRASLQAAITGTDPVWTAEFRYHRADGTYANIYDRSYIIRDSRGQAVRLLGAMMDLSPLKAAEAELKRSYERLRQAQKMESLGQLAGGVAHDFNNILTVIEGHAELIKRDVQTPEVRDSADEILASVIRGSSLTRQLLTFSRKSAVHSAPINLNEVVHGLGKMLRRLLGDHIALEIHAPPHGPVVRADRGMLEQVVMNLVINARDAMPEGGKLSLSTAQVELPAESLPEEERSHHGTTAFARLRVADAGCGIPPENLEKIFEPFFTTKSDGKGTGLGLATVYGIVKQHHGFVKVSSKPHAGTIFDVFLPLTHETPRTTRQTPAQHLARGSETILLVEDEPSLLQLASSMLRDLGYTVLTATSGGEALKTWAQHKHNISLLLTDVVMPGKTSGVALGKLLLQEKPSLAVIYTSGYSEELVGGEFRPGPNERFLPKPYTPRELGTLVRQCLDQPATAPVR